MLNPQLQADIELIDSMPSMLQCRRLPLTSEESREPGSRFR